MAKRKKARNNGPAVEEIAPVVHRIVIELRGNGALSVPEFPRAPLVAYGMLELARDIVQRLTTGTEELQKAPKSGLVLPKLTL